MYFCNYGGDIGMRRQGRKCVHNLTHMQTRSTYVYVYMYKDKIKNYKYLCNPCRYAHFA